jgi:hypothetical protein
MDDAYDFTLAVQSKYVPGLKPKYYKLKLVIEKKIQNVYQFLRGLNLK